MDILIILNFSLLYDIFYCSTWTQHFCVCREITFLVMNGLNVKILSGQTLFSHQDYTINYTRNESY